MSGQNNGQSKGSVLPRHYRVSSALLLEREEAYGLRRPPGDVYRFQTVNSPPVVLPVSESKKS